MGNLNEQDFIKADNMSAMHPIRNLILRSPPEKYEKTKSGFKLYPIGTIEVKNGQMWDPIEKRLIRAGAKEKVKNFYNKSKKNGGAKMADVFPEELKSSNGNAPPEPFKTKTKAGKITIKLYSYKSGGFSIILPKEFIGERFSVLFDKDTLNLIAVRDMEKGRFVGDYKGTGRAQYMKEKVFNKYSLPIFSGFPIEVDYDGAGFEIEFTEDLIAEITKFAIENPPRKFKEKKEGKCEIEEAEELDRKVDECQPEPLQPQTSLEKAAASVEWLNEFCRIEGYTPTIEDGKIILEKHVRIGA